eukprot:m.27098 g.27098  ORF g.27098 m.27098 type:complete len:480 (-) comp8895_c0_seq1:1322-2761(-)
MATNGTSTSRFNDEQLLQVFEKLDEDKDGFITLEQVQLFASQAGFKNPNLSGLDYNGTGTIDFNSFAKGVRNLVGEVAETPKVRRRQLPKARPIHIDASQVVQDSTTEDEASDPEHDDGDSHQNLLDGGEDILMGTDGISPLPSRTAVSGTRRRSLRKSISLGQFSTAGVSSAMDPEEGESIVELQTQIVTYRDQLSDATSKIEDLEAHLHSKTVECEDLRKRFLALEDQYEAEAATFDMGDRIFELESILSKTRADLAEQTKQYEATIESLEEQVEQLTADRDQFKIEKEDLRKGLDLQQKTTKTYKFEVLSLEKTVAELEARLEIEIGKEQRTAQEELSTALSQQSAEYQEQLAELKQSHATTKRELMEQIRDLSSAKSATERELETLRGDYDRLESCLSDPAEYKRRFLKKGMEIAAQPTRSPESLAAEMSAKSRDDLMKEIDKLEGDCGALRRYIDQLLAQVITECPSILEVKGP